MSKDTAWIICETILGWISQAKNNAHDALQDVKDTANLMIKFLKLQRNLLKKVKFEKSFATGGVYV